jgi:hypothetical protein
MLRANYQSRVWKTALTVHPDIPSPAGHGWKLEKEECIIDWIDIHTGVHIAVHWKMLLSLV